MIFPVLVNRSNTITAFNTATAKSDKSPIRNSDRKLRQPERNSNIKPQRTTREKSPYITKNKALHTPHQTLSNFNINPVLSNSGIANKHQLQQVQKHLDGRDSSALSRQSATYSGRRSSNRTGPLLWNITTSTVTTLPGFLQQHPPVEVTHQPKLDIALVNVTLTETTPVDNTTQAIMTETFVSPLTTGDYFSHHKTVMLLVLFSILLLVSLIISVSIFVFCRKKNSVFILQKCEQDSDFELDDFNTEIETTDSEYEDLDCNAVEDKRKRSETYPCLNKYTNDVIQVTNEQSLLHYQRSQPRRSDDNSGSPTLIPLLVNANTAQTGVQIPQRRNLSHCNTHRHNLQKSATFSIKNTAQKSAVKQIRRKPRKNGNIPSKLAYPSTEDNIKPSKLFCVVSSEAKTAGTLSCGKTGTLLDTRAETTAGSLSTDISTAVTGTSIRKQINNASDKLNGTLKADLESEVELPDVTLTTDDEVITVEGKLEIL